jgi:hypothetical protein
MMNELPTIECNCWDSDLGFGRVCKNCKVLLAHEQHAKEQAEKEFLLSDKTKEDKEVSYAHFIDGQCWLGYGRAIRALKGEVKK